MTADSEAGAMSVSAAEMVRLDSGLVSPMVDWRKVFSSSVRESS